MNNEETKILNVSIEGTGGSCSQSVKSLQNGKYRIERILGQGGFGITYLATDVTLNRKVAIKEFFLKEFCLRNTMASVFVSNPTNSEFVERYLSKFLKEARTLANLRHENIIQVYEFFEENNTAYYVMEYIEGETLQEIVTRKGKLVEQEALGYMNQVAEALEYIHSLRINHLDVKPANIMVRKSDGRAVLIDFGGAKQYDTRGDQTSTTPVGISHGYAPMEQYIPGGVSTFSPQTDIYSFGATLYKLVTGNTPPAASEISNSGLPKVKNVDVSTSSSIKKAMSVRKVDRFATIKELQESLIGIEAKLKNWDNSFKGKIYNILESSTANVYILYIILIVVLGVEGSVLTFKLGNYYNSSFIDLIGILVCVQIGCCITAFIPSILKKFLEYNILEYGDGRKYPIKEKLTPFFCSLNPFYEGHGSLLLYKRDIYKSKFSSTNIAKTIGLLIIGSIFLIYATINIDGV